jgi:hypothetical protein
VITRPDKSYDFSRVFLFWSLLAAVGVLAFAFLNEKSVVDASAFEVKAKSDLQIASVKQSG